MFKKYPSTIQFSGIVKQVRDHCKYHNIPLPTLTFSGSVKLHGTNACIGFNPSGEVWFQSRENLITYEKDNAGFATWCEQNITTWKEAYKIISNNLQLDHECMYIYGEWFGSSIQKGVAVSQLKEKHFGIFRIVLVHGDNEFDIDFKCVDWFNGIERVHVIDDIVPPKLITIDFTEPHLAQNELLELTLEVEKECPVGKYFGISGVGEGLVWTATDVEWLPKFKTKGEKHQSSKVTTLRELTEAEITSKANATEFVEFACTENRLLQGISKLSEMGLDVDIKNMGPFLKWVGSDILTECKDTLIASKIERKDVMPRVADKARNWYLKYLNSDLGLS